MGVLGWMGVGWTSSLGVQAVVALIGLALGAGGVWLWQRVGARRRARLQRSASAAGANSEPSGSDKALQ